MEIADSCIRLLSDRELAASLAERGREIVRMNYAQVPFNQEVEAAIGKVLNFRAAINSVSKH